MLVESDHGGMNALADLIRTGKLRPESAATFPLSDAAAAHRLGETERIRGKIVLVPDHPMTEGHAFVHADHPRAADPAGGRAA